MDARNKGLGAALSGLVDVEVPDTLITNQAKEKYAVMMTDFRDQGMADDDIKKLISPENFLKYKDIEKADIVKDFKVSMAIDEIARLEGIEVPSYQVDEQLEALKKEAPSDEKIDENMLRSKIETTLQRRLVYDFLAEHGVATVSYEDDATFDENLMENLAAESLKREEELAKAAASAASIENSPSVEQGKDNTAISSKAETVKVESKSIVSEDAADGRLKRMEKTQRSLLQSRIQSDLSTKAAKLALENDRLKHEAEIKAKEEEKARLHAEAEAVAKAKLAEASRMKAVTSEKVQRSLLQARIQSDLSTKAAKEAEKARIQAEADLKLKEDNVKKMKQVEMNQRSLLAARLRSMSDAYGKVVKENDRKAAIVSARSQPKPVDIEKSLADRYAKMDLSERAYNILKDLGMIDITPDVESPDYDHSNDQDFVSS